MAEEYEIKNIQDVINAVNVDNIDYFLQDLKSILLHTSLVKAANGGSMDGISMTQFTWTDDRKNNLDLEFKSKDSDTSLKVKITDKKQQS